MFSYIIKNILIIIFINTAFINCAIAVKLKSSDIDKLNEVFDIIKDKYPEQKKDELIINGAIDGMLRSLDAYSGYYDPEDYIFINTAMSGRYGGVGITYEMATPYYRIIGVTAGDIADLSGIKVNDIITHVDDIPVNTLSLAKISNMIRGIVGKKVKITVLRQGKETLYFTMIRQEIKEESIIYDTHENIAIFKITTFNEQTYDQLLLGIKKIVLQNKNINGIILDLRDNPGGLLEVAFDISNIFLQDGVDIVSVKGKDNYIIEKYAANDLPDITHGLPIVVLINHESASASEIVSAALRDNKRAVLVGETTFGKATVQVFIDLNNILGAAAKITIGHYYTPKNSKIDKIGVTPDIEIKNPPYVKLSNEDLIIKDDIQMKKAIQIISNNDQYRRILKLNNIKISDRRW